MSETSKTYEMFWDCQYCGAAELLGKTHRHCPACGGAQDPEARYFPSEEKKVAVEDHVFVGVDVSCENCSTPNGAKAEFCGNCGAPLGDGDKKVTLAHERVPRGAPAAPPPKKGGRKGLMIGVTVAVLVLVVVGILVAVFWTRSSELVVTGHTWERVINIEAFRSVKEGEWCDSKPAGAYSVRRSKKQRGTKSVADGQTCRTENVDKGDGTFEQVQRCETKYREEPVYDQWCDFTIDKWVHARAAKTDGNARKPAPAWPKPKIKSCQGLGCERLGQRDESYTVLMIEDGPQKAKQTCDFAQKRWAAIAGDSRWQADVRVLTGGVVCDSLRAPGK